MSLPRDTVITAPCGEHTLKATISPCSWMHSNYGLQLGVTIDELAGEAFVHTKAVTFEQATEADALALLAPVKVIACAACGGPTFDRTTVDFGTNAEGHCHKCFMKKLNEEYAASEAAEEAELRELDAQHLAEGYTHRVDAWLHPAQGDDEQVSFWMQNATDKAVKKELKAMGSQVLDDYKIKPLNKALGPYTLETFAVGKTFVHTSIRHRSDGLIERQVHLVRITDNNGWNANWEVVARLWGENVLREDNGGGGHAVHPQALQYLNREAIKDRTMNPTDENFVQFCRGLTNKQLENVLMDEWKAHGHRDYGSAVAAATERGWTVKDGERQS